RSGVMVRVPLGRVAVVLGRMKRVAVSNLGVVSGLLVISALGVLCRLAMVFRGVFMMLGGLFVMFVNLVRAHMMLQSEGTWSLDEIDELAVTFVQAKR